MNRALIPGAFDRFGVARPFHRCTDACLDGCPLDRLSVHEMELDCDVAPDADRVIQPPPLLPDDMRSRLLRRALYLSALLFSVLAGLLEAFGASPFERIVP